MNFKLIYIVFFGSVFGCFAQTIRCKIPILNLIRINYYRVYYLDTSNNASLVLIRRTKKIHRLNPNRQEQLVSL